MSDHGRTTHVVRQPLLTVSVAAYNAEGWLKRCLDSCLGFDELEVIVVDDGSTDKTASIVESYMEKSPGIFRLIKKENGHYGSTVNASLSEATGKYYRLLDSDDWFSRDGLRCWLDVLTKTDADIAVTASVRVMEKSGEESIQEPCPNVAEGDYAIDSFPEAKIPGPGISNLAWRTDFLKSINLRLLEHCNYVDEELRSIPWCNAETVRIDHIVVYCVLKERDGQNTSLEGLRRSAGDKARMLDHLMSAIDLGRPGNRTRAQDMALGVVINDVVVGCYSGLLILPPSVETKNAIVEFDRDLREKYSELYSITSKVRVIRMLRASHFLLYAPIARHRVRKWSY